jgi:hypothetical protein
VLDCSDLTVQETYQYFPLHKGSSIEGDLHSLVVPSTNIKSGSDQQLKVLVNFNKWPTSSFPVVVRHSMNDDVTQEHRSGEGGQCDCHKTIM